VHFGPLLRRTIGSESVDDIRTGNGFVFAGSNQPVQTLHPQRQVCPFDYRAIGKTSDVIEEHVPETYAMRTRAVAGVVTAMSSNVFNVSVTAGTTSAAGFINDCVRFWMI
jgi:hypothetical protein